MNSRRLWIPKLAGCIFGSTVALGTLAPIVAPGVSAGVASCSGSQEQFCYSNLGMLCHFSGTMQKACQATIGGGPGHTSKNKHTCVTGCHTPNGNHGGTSCTTNNQNCYY
jgi:hypothetical protein